MKYIVKPLDRMNKGYCYCSQCDKCDLCNLCSPKINV